MNREVPTATDEAQMRAFWHEWNDRITFAEAKKEEARRVKA